VAVMHAPGDVRVEDLPEPTIQAPTDAIIRLAAARVCGSDPWPHSGSDEVSEPKPTGHEYVSVVEQVESIKVGDFVVGLLAVLAAKELGAKRSIAMSRHADLQALAREFGATDIVEKRGDAGIAKVKELTDGLRAYSVVEAVGTQESMMQTIAPPASAATSGSSMFLHAAMDQRRAIKVLLQPRYRPTPVIERLDDESDL
jgi:threonine dehydrogenase-like Zn-dependent dehydrogenase